MKVAQQFIAGIALRRVRPDRDDRFTLCPREVPLETITSTFSIVPSGTAPPLHHLPSNELLGYYHEVPSGTRLFRFYSQCHGRRVVLCPIRSRTVMPYESLLAFSFLFCYENFRDRNMTTVFEVVFRQGTQLPESYSTGAQRRFTWSKARR
jgi:hypothetical protein